MQNLPGCHEELYMMALLNLKLARDRCPPLNWDPVNGKFRIGDIVLLNWKINKQHIKESQMQ